MDQGIHYFLTNYYISICADLDKHSFSDENKMVQKLLPKMIIDQHWYIKIHLYIFNKMWLPVDYRWEQPEGKD